MRIVIECEECALPSGKDGCLWHFQGGVECLDCFKGVADGAYKAAMDYLKSHAVLSSDDADEQKGEK